MKLSKIKLLDLISNAPRSNKKKYIKGSGNNSGGAIKVNSIEDADANDYEPGTIVRDKHGIAYVSTRLYKFSIYDDLSEYLEEPEYRSDFDEVFEVDGVKYRRWQAYNTQQYDENQKHHDIVITIEDSIFEHAVNNDVDIEKTNLNPFILAIAAGDYNATLEDESTLDYNGVVDTDRAFIAYEYIDGMFNAYSVKLRYLNPNTYTDIYKPMFVTGNDYRVENAELMLIHADEVGYDRDTKNHYEGPCTYLPVEDINDIPEFKTLLDDYHFNYINYEYTPKAGELEGHIPSTDCSYFRLDKQGLSEESIQYKSTINIWKPLI